MDVQFYACGEILWDCLPTGRHPGGAPFNVAVHLAQLGATAGLISAIGQDAAGDELLQIARVRAVDTRFVDRAGSGLPTGTVNAQVDALGVATYDIVQPVAWDELCVSAATLAAVQAARGLVFGSLAGRSPPNREHLRRLLALPGPRKFLDVNLRPPFASLAWVMELARHTDVLKLNQDELGRLATWAQTGSATPIALDRVDEVAAACATLAEATGPACICVTMGASGAVLWQDGEIIRASSPEVPVTDTVGAGDAFMAALVLGLTNGAARQSTLDTACVLGAFVASQPGATPALPPARAREWLAALQPQTDLPVVGAAGSGAMRRRVA